MNMPEPSRPKSLKFRGGTTAERMEWIGMLGEPFTDTDLYEVFLSDGVTPGGILVSAPLKYITPDSVEFIVGTSADLIGTVQTLDDGPFMTVAEAAGSPGMDVQFGFTEVKKINGIVLRYYYEGSGNHNMWIQMWNYNTLAWTNIISGTGAAATNFHYETIHIPVAANYMNAGDALIRFYHPESGIPSHRLYIDYIALQY